MWNQFGILSYSNVNAIHRTGWVKVLFLFFLQAIETSFWDGEKTNLIFFSVANGKTASSLDTLSSSIIIVVIVIFIHYIMYHPRVDNGAQQGTSRDRGGLSHSHSLMRLEK